MRKKREVERFARWCFAKCNVLPCSIFYAPAYCLIANNGECCFGCYKWDEEKREPGEIFVAYHLPKWHLMSTIAHEIIHHKQHMERDLNSLDIDACEEEAEKESLKLMGLWLLRGGKVRPEEDCDR